MKLKYYELQRGDIAKHGDELYTFQKMDGAYAQWLDKNGEIKVGHCMYYEKNDEGIYIPSDE